MMQSKRFTCTGWTLSILAILFLVLDGVMKLFKPQVVIDSTLQLGFPESSILLLGIVLLISTVLYAIPRTCVLGAILLTGYLGGAVAAHVRLNDPLFSHILFGVYLGLFVWGGLWFRSQKLRTLIPLVNTKE